MTDGDRGNQSDWPMAIAMIAILLAVVAIVILSLLGPALPDIVLSLVG